ncbi:MAG: PD-(D/E)XK nuclease family protein [Candidatus Cryptobacteroides sp.]|nr:PD-(D/E)XK nuclease family protein [Candidatus Cryptobacteroides sp.]
MDSHDIISGLLNEVFLCIDERIASGEDYSVLETAIKGNEEMMHSSVIASLLDTRGSHGQKCRFLELFLGCLPEQFKSFDASGARTACERHIGQKTENSGGRVDICIENSKGQMIVIENKIFAGDQEHQILRYVEFLRGMLRDRGGVKFPVLYLTPDGHSPSDDSTQTDGMQCRCGEDYVCISYRDVIVPWLDKCINEMEDKPHLKEHLTTYRDIIRKKVLGMDRKKDIINIIERTEKNIKAAREISGQLDEIKIDAVTTFWRTIKKNLEEDDLRPEFCHFDANMKLMTVRDIEGLVRKYVDRPNEDNRYFGISVKLQNDGHFCLLVEENIYFAIAPKSVDESALKDWKTELEDSKMELKDWKMDSGRFVAWKYPYSGKKSLLSPDDDIWKLAHSKNKNTDAVSCDLITQLLAEFTDIVRKLPDRFRVASAT